ncbi:hypothetical protein CyaNS01_02858 [Cyanobium sp. NS01]|nr:hypothetical protein CyaNS01_02858 [Cyanobium sp. NS01]
MLTPAGSTRCCACISIITGQPVDLVMADAVCNPYVRADIEVSKQLIYAA